MNINRRHILLKEFNIKRSRNECPVIVTVPSTWTKGQYEQIARIFFETFNSPGLYIANHALMALYGCGNVTGLVVDIGYVILSIKFGLAGLILKRFSKGKNDDA